MATKVIDRVVYKTINLINNKIYIGQDSYNNPRYLGSGVILKKDIKKYGRINFEKEILCYCNSPEELDEMEIYYIDKFNAKETGYNLLDGGKGNSSLRYIKNMSISLSGFKNPMYGKSLISLWIEKYGEDRAKQLWNECNIKRSISAVDKGTKKVKVFDKYHNYINEFNSLKEASSYTSVGYKYIKRSNKHNNITKGYYFKY